MLRALLPPCGITRRGCWLERIRRMSCDNNTRAYCERAGARIAPALGVSPAEATELLLQVHELGATRAEQALASRREGGGQGVAARQAILTARAADTAAEEATVEIFREMRAMSPRMDVPAHGDPHPEYGFALPKRPAQYGWKEVRDLRRHAYALHGAPGRPPADPAGDFDRGRGAGDPDHRLRVRDDPDGDQGAARRGREVLQRRP